MTKRMIRNTDPQSHEQDPMTAARVQEALSAVYSPGVSNEDRKVAQQFLDSFKIAPNSLPIALYLAHPLSSPITPPETRHFALSVIEESIRTKWDGEKFSAEGKASIQTFAEEILAIAANGDAVNSLPAFLREKVAKVIVEVAKASWPDSWPGLNGKLLGYYEQNTPISQDLTLSVLRILCEDVFLFDDSAAARRKKFLIPPMQAIVLPGSVVQELPDSDIAEAAKLMGMGAGTEFSSWIGRIGNNAVLWAQRYEAAAQSGGTLPFGATQRTEVLPPQECERIAEAHLRTLATMVEWALVKGIAETKVVYRLLELLASTSARIRLAASDTLLPIFSRGAGATPEDPLRLLILVPIFSEGGLDLLIHSYGRTHGCFSGNLEEIRSAQAGSRLPEDSYSALKGVVQALLVLGDEQVCFKKATSLPANFDKFVKFAAVIAEHPSLNVAMTALTLWSSILKHETTCQTLEVASCLSSLLENVASRICFLDHRSESPPTGVVAHYIDIDAPTTIEARQLAVSSRSRCIDVVRAISGIKPLHTCIWIARRLAQKIENSVEGDNQWLWMMLVDVAVFEATIRSAGKTDDDSSNKQYSDELHKILGLLVSFQPKVPSVIRAVNGLTVTIAESSNTPPHLLFASVEKLFSYSYFVYADETVVPNTNRGVEAREVRAHAIGGLIKLGTAMPDTFMSFYDKITEQIGRIFEGGTLTDLEKTQMVDFAMCIIYFSSYPADHKQNLFNSVAEPYISDWSSSGFSQVLSSPASFLQFLGCAQVSDCIKQMDGRLDIPLVKLLDPITLKVLKDSEFTRRKVGSCLMRGIGYFSPQKPRVAALSSTIFVDVSEADLRSTQTISAFRVSKILFLNFHSTMIITIHKKSDDPSIVNLWIPFLPQIIPSLMGFARIIHLIWDLAYWEPYARELREVLAISQNEKRLALEYFSPLLGQMLPPLFDFVGRKLDADWKVMAANGIRGTTSDAQPDNESMDGDDSQEDENEITDEIVHETLLRMLTRSFADLIFQVFDLKKPDPNAAQAAKDVVEQPKKTPRATPNVPAPEFLHKELAEFVLSHPVSYIRIPIFKSTLKYSMYALHDPYHTEMQGDLLTAITELYSSLRPVSNIPREILATLPEMDPQQILDFDKQFVTKNSLKDQVSTMRRLLSTVTGVSISQWFKREDLTTLHAAKAKLLWNSPSQRYSLNGKSSKHESTEEEKESNFGLENLFE
ncbi:hypothetical protein HDU93_006973 [Gonapodya sp. JEL0774]|nr:hypothetical protein HDU93_006973 [Gonapodya sp. JEL0774]